MTDTDPSEELDVDPTRYEEQCERCGTSVEAFTRQCPRCGFQRDTFTTPIDPEYSCIDCGAEAHTARCGCCGFPLCSRHHEAGGGFCGAHCSVGGVPVCPHEQTVAVGVHPREETVLVVPTSDADYAGEVFHLPDEAGITAPACRPHEAGQVGISVYAAREELGRELCIHCGKTARKRHEAFKQELAAALADDEGVNR